MRRPTWRALALGVLALTALAGCDDKDKRIERLQAFLLQPRKPVAGVEYIVLPPDILAIHSVHVPEINATTVTVRPDGKINMPLLGELDVAGKTPRQIEIALAEASKKYYEVTDATVDIVGYNSQKIYVFGQVGRPGPLPWTGADTVVDVLAIAQPTNLAWPERIHVIRCREPIRGGFVPTTQPAWQDDRAVNPTGSKDLLIDMMAMVEKGDMSRNILLYPDDIVYVQPNPFARVGLALQAVLFPVEPVLEAVRVPATIRDAGHP